MKIGRYIKKFFSHRYLIQLIVTGVVFLLFPCVLALYFTMYNAYQKIQKESQEFYLSSAKNYFDGFLDEMDSLITLSYQISSDSREKDGNAYYFRTDLLKSNLYYFAEATRGISFYRNNVSSALAGIYYPDKDWVITNTFKYSVDSYVTDALKITGLEQTEICDFLENSTKQKISMYSLFPQADDSEFLLMTVSTYMGYGRSPVILLYYLDLDYLQNGFLSSAKATGLQFCIYDGSTDQLLLSAGAENVDLSLASFDFDSKGLESGKSFSLKQGDREFSCFFSYSEPKNFYYGVIGSYDEIYCTSLSYFKTMQFVIVGVCILLLTFLAILIYIDYKPIYALLHKVLGHDGDGGIDDISTAIDSMTGELNELNFLLKDYLLENILRGKPVNEALTKRLGITRHHGDYRVYAVSGISLNTEERTILTEELLNRFSVPSFITDILMQNITVIVCLIPKNDGTGTTEYLRNWLKNNHPDADFYEGSIVDSINHLHQSYITCGIMENAEYEKSNMQKRQEAKNAQATEQAAQLAQEILKYLQENFCDPCLSQVSVADMFHISTYTLSRLFKNQFGIGFTEFISSQRMEYAKQLLLTTDAPVGEIAARVGLPNLNYFSRLFRVTTGISPTKYRASQDG